MNRKQTIYALALALAFGLVSGPAAAQGDPVPDTVDEGVTDPLDGQPADDAPAAPSTSPETMHDGDAPPDEYQEEPEPEVSDFTDRNLTLGLTAGIYLPNLINDLGPHVTLGVEVGYLLPFFDKRLAIVFETGWAPPTTDGVEPDTRLATPEYSYETATQKWHVSLGPVFRILRPGTTFVPYVGLLARVYMLRAEVSGRSGDNAFGTNTEESTEVGFVARLGGEIRLGPGALSVQFDFGWSDWPHTVTGDTSTGALAGTLGYRLFL